MAQSSVQTQEVVTAIDNGIMAMEKAFKEDKKENYFVSYMCGYNVDLKRRVASLIGKNGLLIEFDPQTSICCVGIFGSQEQANKSIVVINEEMEKKVSGHLVSFV